jgi:hypothetical protein
MIWFILFSNTSLKWKLFELEIWTDSRYFVLDFYQINRDGKIRTYNHMIIKTLILYWKTISTQYLKLLDTISEYNLCYSLILILVLKQEADQLQRGIRRHLNFGAAIACEHSSYGAHETSNLCLPDSYKYFESSVPPHFDPRGITGSWQARSCAQTATLQSSFFPSECEPVRSPQNCGNRALSSCIPSVGDNFVRSDSVGSDSSIRKKLRSNLHQHKKKLMSDGDHYLGKEMNGILLGYCYFVAIPHH